MSPATKRPMRIAFDLDGVLADLHTPFVTTAIQLFPELDAAAMRNADVGASPPADTDLERAGPGSPGRARAHDQSRRPTTGRGDLEADCRAREFLGGPRRNRIRRHRAVGGHR